MASSPTAPRLRRLSVAAVAIALVAAPATAHAEGLLLGDEYRWANTPVLQRTAMDVVAIPANAVHWEPREWVIFGLWFGAVGSLMFVGDPVADVQVDRWITRNLDGRAPEIWTVPMQAVLWGSIAAGGLGTWGWAGLTRNDEIGQGLSLMGEALAVSQVYHLTIKLLLGREGPEDGEGNAAILGPGHSLRLFPAGTPSGHSATLYSLMSAAFAYFQPPLWIQAVGHVVIGGLVAFHVINHRHFISDSLWGAAMGWSVGQWVVKHRASWRFGERKKKSPLVVAPFVRDRIAGVGVSGAF